jgi:hypothetical protein
MARSNAQFPFDPAAMIAAAKDHRAKAEALENVLRSHGISLDEETEAAILPTATKNGHEKIRPKRAYVRRAVTKRRGRKRSGPKLSDAAFKVLAGHDWRAHGKVIVKELLDAGLMANVGAPGSNVSTALSRDERFERDSDVPNTWIVKKEYRKAS